MNKAASVKLSLRKLFIAILAIGPLAIVPSPLWAVPATTQYNVTNGSVSLVAGSTVSTFTVSDRSVLVWTGNDSAGNTFNLPAGETWTFAGLSSTGAVLNKVGYNTNGTTNGLATAVISGALNSTGKVFILANGNIVVNSGASIDTAGGLVLSTLGETSDFNFTTQGNLSFSGSSTGSITIGNTTNYATTAGNIGNGTGTFTGTFNGSANTGTANVTASATAVGVTTSGLAAWAGNVVVNNITVAGDLLVNQTTANLPFTPATGITSAGNVTVTTNNGVIGNSTGLWTVANGTTSLTTNGNVVIDVSNAANNFSTIAVSAGTGTGGNVTISDANNITLGASTVGQDLIVVAAPGGFAGNGTAVGTSGAVAVKGNLAVTTTSSAGNSAISIGNSSSVGGLLNLTTTNSSITFNGIGNVNMGVVTTNPSASGNRSSVTITTNGVLTIGNTITTAGNTTAGGAVSLTGNSIVQTATILAGNATNWGSISMNATGANITTGTMSSNQTITLNASAGSINVGGQTGTLTSLTAGNASVKTSSTGTANLTGTNAYAAGSVLQFTGGNIALTNTNALVVGSTNATGNVTIVDGGTGVTIGTGTGTLGQNIVVGGNLAVTANGTGATITDSPYSAMNVFGTVNLITGVPGTTAGGAITLNAARTNLGLSPSIQFGAISANTGNGAGVTVAETSTLNLALVNATTLTAASVTGNIVQSGQIITSTSTTATVGSTGTITLGNTSNSFGTTGLLLGGGTDATVAAGSTIILGNSSTAPANVTLTTGSGVAAQTAASSTFGNLTINAGGAITQAGALSGNSITLNGTSGVTTSSTLSATNLTLQSPAAIAIGGTVSPTNLVINSTATGAAVTETGALVVSGNATVTSSGNVTLNGNNDFVAVTINTAGDTTVNDINNLTIAGTAAGVLTTTAGFGSSAIANTWNLTLGNLTVANLTATASNGGGGNSGSITQAAGSVLHVENNASFTTTQGNIIVANAGNSAGRVGLFTGGSSVVTVNYAEDGTIKLGNILSNGTATLTARNGSIIEDTSANNVYTNNGTVSLQAPNGSVSIGNTTMTGTGFTSTGNITTFTINAPSGGVAVASSGANVTLSTINANSLTVNATGNLSQSNPLSVFGTANITSAGNITLTNNSNNFGPIIINSTAGSKNISINESGTMNLRTIAMAGGATGNFTATSVNGDIISSGFGGVRPGGTTASPGTGVVTLVATKGNITVGDATTDFPTSGGVVFNGNNVSLTVLGNSTLVLGSNSTPAVAGNLTITSAIGSVSNAGNVVVSGNGSFTTGNGNISLNQAGNQFGTLKFSGNQVNVIQSNDMKLLTGSSALGASSLATSGNFSVVSAGGVASFGGTLSLIATGSITLPKLIQVGNTLTVNAAGTKDLSALSISGDLSAKTPVNLGTGSYTAPQP